MSRLVDARDVHLVYRPTPAWLRWLIRSAISEPVHALRGVDLQLDAGEIVGVIGPNGAGKSSLFRILVGLIHPTVGEVEVLGRDSRSHSLELRRRVGFMPPDDRTLFLRYSCVENLRFHARLHGFDSSETARRIDVVLRRVDLLHARDRAAVALSSGMRYRLLLARAMLHDPSLLILDEPTGPLDPVTAHEFVETLKQIVDEQGMGVLISSHRMDDIESLRRRVVLLDDGAIVYDGSVDELRRRHQQDVLVLTIPNHDEASTIGQRLAGRDDVASVETISTGIRLTTNADVGALLATLPSVEGITNVEREQLALRDVMARIVAERRERGTT